MGTFRYTIRIGRLDGSVFETVEALVDTGATYTWVPRPILERVGVTPTTRRRLQTATGQIIERDAGPVLVTVDGDTVATTCIFGDADSMPLLGTVTLQACGLAVDPIGKKLVPVVGLLAALPT